MSGVGDSARAGLAFRDWPFLAGWGGGAGGGGVLMGSVDSRELGVRASTSRFILLVRFSDTLLLVSILDMVYDCHLRPLLQS